MLPTHATSNSASTRRDRRTISAAVPAVWLLTFATMVSHPAISHELRIQHVIIVSPERPQSRRNATVIVKDGRIAAILDGDTARRPRGDTPHERCT